ncbi:MAG: MG2 domain-containing protein, partial [Armatimonadetes bacterium]|nr:MG2 domain-containing protein [Armatimonadota bacterium]
MPKVSARLMRWIAIGVIAVAVSVAIGAGTTTSEGDISPLQTVILGQSTWLAGGPASMRVIVTNHETGEPVGGAVHIGITPTDQQAMGKLSLYSGTLSDGTLQASFDVPEVNPGTYELSVRVVSQLGIDDVKQPVTIARSAQILLTTDKPLYQPGQTIHLRALALMRPSMKPAAGAPVTLEVEDAKGNKVFKKTIDASDFGIVSAEFVLADEINMGPYKVRAVMEDGQAERTVEVKRYVLPKFKLDLTTDRTYYLPGETMTGKVQCDYFFGKPTSRSDVLITVSAFDVEFHEVAEIKGKTDENGTFEFETELPTYFVGQPLEQGNAFVKLDCEVTDRAEHTEKVTEMIPVAKDPVVITVVPESGEIKPGLENILYVLASKPDGSPVAGAQVAISGPNLDFRRGKPTTDEAGICAVHVAPKPGAGSVHVEVRSEGVVVVRDLDLAAGGAEASLILRSSQALAKVGDAVGFTVISTKQRGTTYVDVIRDSQTVLTKAVDLEGGRSEFELPLTQ